ncbi:MAG TPA: DUF1207 domain-containing protein [Nitrospira sp.]|nr:DUF1207 domain-containing protein [Nitrospira sp.]
MGRKGRQCRLVLSLGFCCWLWLTGNQVFASDEYIAGYASAMLEHEFRVTDAVVEVRDGDIVVTAKTLGNVDRGKIESSLRQIPGVSHVTLRTGDPASVPSSREAAQVTIPESHAKWLPRGLLFSPLHADPRWPHFSASYRHFTQGMDLSGVFAANFGETFAIYRNRSFFGGEWDIGVQAGVFSIFDISSASIDLINADYRVGVLSSYRNGRFSLMGRILHQSSHLGDEFLLNNPGVTRINLSYEAVDMKLSYEFFDWLRLYGGGGVVVHRQPDDLGLATTQWGIELVSTRTFLDGLLRPVAYGDFQCNQMTNWGVGQSIMAGVQFENARIGDRRIQILGEYYAGPSPDGQFYPEHVSWYGIGVHLYF